MTSYTPPPPQKKKHKNNNVRDRCPHSTAPKPPPGHGRDLSLQRTPRERELGSLAPRTHSDSSHHQTNFPGFPASSAPAPASFVCIPALLGPRSGARPRSPGPESTLRRAGSVCLPSFLSFLPLRNAESPLHLPPGAAFLAGGLFLKVRAARPASCWEPWRRRRRAGVGRQGVGGAGGKRLRPL